MLFTAQIHDTWRIEMDIFGLIIFKLSTKNGINIGRIESISLSYFTDVDSIKNQIKA